MTAVEILLFVFAVFGHIGLWCGIFSQVHATRWTRPTRKVLEKLIFLATAGLLLLMSLDLLGQLPAWHTAIFVYSIISLLVLVALLVFRLFTMFSMEAVPGLRQTTAKSHNFAKEISSPAYIGKQAGLLGSVPGNQSLKLSVEKRQLSLDVWPKELDGLVIAQLSDLHFTGKINKEYFQHVVRVCNAQQPDIVLVTGDIVDKRDCVDWLPETLGQLQAKHSMYYILGNHDLRVKDEDRLRKQMEDLGFVRAVGQWIEVEIQGHSIWLAGNELPWFPGAENLPAAKNHPAILLSHSPDQVYDADQLDVDLMFAGHCHGGQIRLPLLGPIVAPSRYGVRFASGTFRIGSVLMHVSRGISGDDPIRLNCCPELAVFEVSAS